MQSDANELDNIRQIYNKNAEWKKLQFQFYRFCNRVLIINLEQKHLAFQETLVPLFVTILYAEPRHIRISTTIGAKGRYFAFLSSFKKRKKLKMAARSSQEAVRRTFEGVRRPFEGVRSSFDGIIFSSNTLFYWAEHKNSWNNQNPPFAGL